MKTFNRRNFIKKTGFSAASLYMTTNLACSEEYE